jgi:hypothetical protein
MSKSACRVAVALIGILGLSGCATPTEYHADAAHPIRTITVAREVPVPNIMTFVGFSESIGMGLAGGIGGPAAAGFAAAELFSRPGSEQFHIGEAVRAEFIAAIQKSGKFTVKQTGPADAELQLKVNGYGFYQTGVFARRVRPVLGVEAKLTRPNGQIVWQHRRGVAQTTSKTPALLPEKIKADPKLGAEALHVAARLCAETAVRSINQ